VDLRILAPRTSTVRLQRDASGYHRGVLEQIEPGALYVYRLDGLIERPDPASRCQPHGPRGPTCLIDSRFAWKDRQWRGLALSEYIIHESSDSTAAFDDLIPGLGPLRDLGATALSVRLDAPPLSGLPGSVPVSRGGPAGLQRLVDVCHRKGLAVMLGAPLFEPGFEGDPFASFGPYFTGPDRRINIDGPHSDEVRRYFLESALRWFREFHIDTLDVGTIDSLVDLSPMPLIEELSRTVRDEAKRIGRPLYLVAQSERNNPRLICRREDGGIGLDAVWNRDFCLALQGALSRERTPSLPEFGKLAHLKKAFLEGFVCSGEFSHLRLRSHGRSSRNLPGDRFLVSCPLPEDPGRKTDTAIEKQKLVDAALLFSPFVPMLFFEGAEAVCSGSVHGLGPFHCELARLRKELRSAGLLDKQRMGILGYEKEKVLLARYWNEDEDLIVLFNAGRKRAVVPVPIPAGSWRLRFDSADRRWKGPGGRLPRVTHGGDGDIPMELAARSCAVYTRFKTP
jgi:maltooligosyltrehalose trehalohydrolase